MHKPLLMVLKLEIATPLHGSNDLLIGISNEGVSLKSNNFT
jgi:hypothetical protein